jgi:hypothetical protein
MYDSANPVIHGDEINPLNTELNLLALLGTHHILHISRIRVKYTRSLNEHRSEA